MIPDADTRRRVFRFAATAAAVSAVAAAAASPSSAAQAPAQAPAPAVAAAAPGEVRQIPPPGKPIPDADRVALTAGVEALGREIDSLRAELAGKPDLLRCIPDVQIYYNAVYRGLNWDEFYAGKNGSVKNEVEIAKRFLGQGLARAQSLRAGSAPWLMQPGMVALGYVSRIDGSVQPYGLLIPREWAATDTAPHPLWIFCHGRGENLTELSFVEGHQKGTGEFSPPNTFVLHPYGRFCNASRYAGEVDTFEAIDNIKLRFPIDNDRVAMLGFSMGGASSWQYATHHADQWVAASPGAGFTDTASYTGALAPGKIPPPWYVQKLWRLYDPVAYAVNLAQCPTIAYSGEIDAQKRAADNMEDAMAKEGLKLTRSIGPKTGHAYHKNSKPEIVAFITAAEVKGRDTKPKQIRFTTFTLRYNRMNWITVDGLGQHWERARVDADRSDDSAKVSLKTENVTALHIDTALLGKTPDVTIDGTHAGKGAAFHKVSGVWKSFDTRRESAAPQKSPGLQGPIDDAFMDRFVMVRPTGKPLSAATGAWVQEEISHASSQWRMMFRAEVPIKDDAAVTPDDIAGGNLVLWGDPSSNSVLAKIADRLPIKWAKDGSVTVGVKRYPAGTSVPALIYPNPLNPAHYVVLNSGITWREAQVLTNANQTPHLPDWAVIDITTPPDKTAPGRIADAGFFDENWRLSGAKGK